MSFLAFATSASSQESASAGARLDPVTRAVVRALPAGWRVDRATAVPDEALGPIRDRFPVPFEALSNATLAVHGLPIRVNTFRTANEADATQLHARLLAFKGGDSAACARVGRHVVEFVCANRNRIRRAAWDLGIRPTPKRFRFRVSLDAVPIDACDDDMRWNELFNALCAKRADAVERLRPHFRFGRTLTLRRDVGATFTPAPRERRTGPAVTTWTFDALPERDGVPIVGVRLTVEPARETPTDVRPPSTSTQATAYWPSDDPTIERRARAITADAASDAARVAALLRWLQPGAHLRYGGRVGSRIGVRRMLAERRGRCWDFTDVFVTMCRSIDVPARLVAGWLFGGEGHVWAEVFVDGAWHPVDPTGGGRLDCHPYHLAWVTSEDGRMPLVYASMPVIAFVDE